MRYICFFHCERFNNNTFYERNKERLQEKSQNCYHQEDGKEQAEKNILKTKENY